MHPKNFTTLENIKQVWSATFSVYSDIKINLPLEHLKDYTMPLFQVTQVIGQDLGNLLEY